MGFDENSLEFLILESVKSGIDLFENKNILEGWEESKVLSGCFSLVSSGELAYADNKFTIPKKRNRRARAPGTTPQDVKTPPVFLDPVRRVFGNTTFDLAASSPNVCEKFYSETDNALVQSWVGVEGPETDAHGTHNWAWLNQPFRQSSKFIAKADHEARAGAKILNLTVTSTGSVYWAKHVWKNPYCNVIFLIGRVPFIGYDNSANTDCSLLVWGARPLEHRIYMWDWLNPESIPVRIA